MTEEIEHLQLSADKNSFLEIITKNLYSEHKVFLRELISNASDALGKKRIKCAKDKSIKTGSGENCIKITPSLPGAEIKTLTISDTGCGMTYDELIQNLSTMAHSGTKDFLRAAEEGIGSSQLIGRFGVGFFSAFLVADQIEVRTFALRSDDSLTGYLWKSNGDINFSIQKIEAGEGDNIPGTTITLRLKEECAEEYTNGDTLKTIAQQYNAFAAYPIYLYVEREVEEEKPKAEEGKKDEEEEAKKEGEEGDAKVEEVPEEEKEEEKEEEPVKKVKKVVEEKLTTMEPLWKRNKEEVTEEEYEAFYKEISKDWDKHLAVTHFKIESTDIELAAVLYIPMRAPFNLYETHNKPRNIRLYVKRVFIMDDCEEIVPEWLRFVVGTIDSEELDLNVSRETLHKSGVIKQIRDIIVKKVMEMFKDLQKNDQDKFEKFMEAFGKNIKHGIHEDRGNRETLAGFLKYDSSKREKISFDEYMEGIPKELGEEDRKQIFYISAQNKEAAKASPFLEGFKKHGIEVLYLTEPIDEYVTAQMKEYKGAKLVNITKAGVKVPKAKKDDAEDQKEDEEPTEEEKKVIERVKKVLDKEVEKVMKVTYLHESPASVASTEYGWSANFEQMMKYQALKDTTMHQFMMGKKVLCLNMRHPIVRRLGEMEETEEFATNVQMLFYSACLNSGFSIDEKVGGFAEQVYRMMARVLGVELAEAAKEKEQGQKAAEEGKRVQEID